MAISIVYKHENFHALSIPDNFLIRPHFYFSYIFQFLWLNWGILMTLGVTGVSLVHWSFCLRWNAVNPVAAFYNVHGIKGDVELFSSLPNATWDVNINYRVNSYKLFYISAGFNPCSNPCTPTCANPNPPNCDSAPPSTCCEGGHVLSEKGGTCIKIEDCPGKLLTYIGENPRISIM
jgi:hypothetical protein